MNRRFSRSKRAVSIASATFALLMVGTAAEAHVEASPTKVKAGTSAVISFSVPHGCSGSATTKLAIKLPTGVVSPAAISKKGWTSSVVGGVITFSGGTLPATTVAVFKIKATMPTAPGVLVFPTIQTCAKGETAWIELTPAGKPEPDHPAPTIIVVK